MMYRTRRFGRSGKRIADRQSGFLAGRVRRNLSKGVGFTLIELLVVIAIVALLMAILVPVLRSARNQARAVVCYANLKQWGSILNLYTEDNQGKLPTKVGDALWLIRGSDLLEGDPNRPSVYQDIKAKGIACCPMAAKPYNDGEVPETLSGSPSSPYRTRIKPGSMYKAWEITMPLPRFHCSYGFNLWLFDSKGFDASAPKHSRIHRDGYDIFPLRGRANIPVFLDCTVPMIPFLEFYTPPENEQDGGAFFINRHDGYINGLFLDWSARRVGLKELWTLKWHLQFNTAGPWTKAGGMNPDDWPPWMRGLKDY